MLKILVASSKGGCGKSTVSTNLAAHYAQAGKNTAIVDLDRQGSSYRWAERRPENLPGVLGIRPAKRTRWIDQVPDDTDRVIVDSPAGADVEDLAESFEAVDAVIVPVLPSVIDLDATRDYLETFANAARIKRGKLPVALVANRLKPWTNASQNAVHEMAELPFPVIAELRDSSGYVMLTGLGKSIFDYNAENVRSHQADWQPLIKWLKKLGG